MFFSYMRNTLHLPVYFSIFRFFFNRTEWLGGGTYSSYSISYNEEERMNTCNHRFDKFFAFSLHFSPCITTYCLREK
jgi:hypothetical protein